MRRRSTLLVSASALTLFATPFLVGLAHPAAGQDARTDKDKGKAKSSSPLDGAWRLVSSKDPRIGQMRKPSPTIEMTKLVVGGRYAWTIARGDTVVAGAGGKYTVKDDTYTEDVVFTVGPNQQPMAGKSFKFTWKIEDGHWHHKGTIKIGNVEQEIDEIWERIE
jgi:hypothetical protein